MPQFLHSHLGQRYCHVKRALDPFSRGHLFTNLNSTSVANNATLLHMLDPTLIDELDQSRRKFANTLFSPQAALAPNG